MSSLPDNGDWSHIPSHILKAELRRRQEQVPKPECGSGGPKGDYDLGLHVFALFLILIVSFVACAFPIIARRWPKLPIPHYFLFISRHFGTGVLIATAFVHLLPTAFTSLHDPCLPSFWNTGYPPMPGLIAMVSVFVVVGIEMFFATRGAGHIHGSEYDTLSAEQSSIPLGDALTHHEGKNYSRNRTYSSGALVGHHTDDEYEDDDDVATPRRGSYGQVPTLAVHTDEDAHGDAATPRSSMSDEDGPAMLSPSAPALHSHSTNTASRPPLRPLSSTHQIPSDPLQAAALEKKLMLQCLLLEAGILFHSVFIGIALSVTSGPPFIVLLIAITFHQTFEGLALGSRIAAIPTLAPTNFRPWLMAVAYGTTTPIGQAIGLGVHGLYDPAGEVGLLMVGTMNAVSSGLLLFAGLVELLAEDFLSDGSYKTLKGKRRKEACAAVVAGAGLMALVGAWA